MKQIDLDEIANLERAISKKWGEESVQNPRSLWSEDKEEIFKAQLQELHKKEISTYDKETKIEQDGFLLTEKLFTRGKLFIDKCPICLKSSNTARSDVYIKKFDCCFECYVQWVEGREDRWKTGWRPNK
jgi:hypothetical protein